MFVATGAEHQPLALSWEPLEKRHDPGFQGQKEATGPEVRGRRLKRKITRSEDTEKGHGHNRKALSQGQAPALRDRKGLHSRELKQAQQHPQKDKRVPREGRV